ncbi:dTDP-D-glucose 4,6-dehydratase, partial [Lacticaseibacillus paracasei subsp. paracasei Lpp126]
FPEKLIPLMITCGLDGEKLPIYGDGKNIRDWLYVRDNCRGIDLVLREGKTGQIYNIGAHNEYDNNTIVQLIVKQLGLPESQITYVKDRLGHDRRYAVDPTKIMSKLGWKTDFSFTTGLHETIEWYVAHQNWWQT